MPKNTTPPTPLMMGEIIVDGFVHEYRIRRIPWWKRIMLAFGF